MLPWRSPSAAPASETTLTPSVRCSPGLQFATADVQRLLSNTGGSRHSAGVMRSFETSSRPPTRSYETSISDLFYTRALRSWTRS